MSASASSSSRFPMILRDPLPNDLAFIFASWLRNHRDSAAARMVRDTVYFEGEHRLIEDLLLRSKTVVAANAEDLGQIFGWVCGERIGSIAVVHYAFVKGTYRRLGFGRQLLDSIVRGSEAVMFTHQPPDARVLGWLAPEAIYNPFLVRAP